MAMHARGQIAPLVSEVVAMTDVPERLMAITNRGTTGKVVVRVA